MEIEELIETLKTWDSLFYSDSETKQIMMKAAETIEAFKKNFTEDMDCHQDQSTDNPHAVCSLCQGCCYRK